MSRVEEEAKTMRPSGATRHSACAPLSSNAESARSAFEILESTIRPDALSHGEVRESWVRLIRSLIRCSLIRLFAVRGSQVAVRCARFPVRCDNLPAMTSAKESVRRLLALLPDDVTLAEIRYHVHVQAAVQRGLDAAERGELLDQEEVERRMAKWLGDRA